MRRAESRAARRRGADAVDRREGRRRLRGLLRPPRRRRLLAGVQDRRRAGGGRRRHPGGIRLDLAQRRTLRPGARQRPLLDARGSSATGRSTAAQTPGRAPKLGFDDEAALEQRPAASSPTRRRCGGRRRSEVRGALGELPGEQSKVIELAYFGGFSQSEIAAMLGVPLGTVKGRMRLGLEKIRGRAGGGTGMNEREHERRRDELAAYLLGALEPVRRRRWSATGRLRAVPDGARAGCGRRCSCCPERWSGSSRRRSCARGSWAKSSPTPGLGGRGRELGWKLRTPLLRPAVGLAALALVVAALAGYAIREAGGGESATTVAAGHVPGVTAKLVRKGDTGTLRLADVHRLPPARSCRRGYGAARRSNRRRRSSSPTGTAPRRR